MKRTVLAVLVLLTMFVPLAAAQEEPGVILMLRSEDRGTGNDYRQGDVVEVFDDTKPDGSVQRCVLPPAYPFWLVKVHGLTKAEAEQYMQPSWNPDGSLRVKRTWGVKVVRMSQDKRAFFLLHGFIGFGGPEDATYYGAVVDGDFALQWSEVVTWLQNK